MHAILFCLATCLCMVPDADCTLEAIDLLGHHDRIQSVSLSPDGTLLVSGGRDCSIRLWDVARGKLISVLEERECWPMAVRFSPDGRILAVGWADGAIHIWDAATRKLTRRLDDHMNPAAVEFTFVRDISFSPDSRTLASAGYDKTVRIWDIATGRTHHLAQHEDVVDGVFFSHDGTMLASTGFESKIRIWDVASGEQRFAFDKAARLTVRTVLAFSPDDRLLARSGFGSDIRLWDLRSGKLHEILEDKMGRIESLMFFPTRNRLLTAGSDRTIKIWDLDKGKVEATLPVGSASGPQCATLSSDDHIVAALKNGEVVLLSSIPPLYEEIGRIRLDHDEIEVMEVARRQALLAVGSRDGIVTIVRWNKKPGP